MEDISSAVISSLIIDLFELINENDDMIWKLKVDDQ